MLSKIKKLEETARLLEPGSEQRRHWNQSVQQYADHFLDVFNPQKTYVVSESMGKGIYDFPFSENAKSIESVLEVLEREVDTPNLNPAAKGHLGYIPGGGLVTTALGDYLGAITNRYAGIFFPCPGAVRMENMVLRWMCEMVGYPNTALGNLTSGGSIANMSAITTARDFKGIRARDIEKTVVYMTEHLHHCVAKSLRIVGMAECITRYIPTDANFKMIPEALGQQIQEDLDAGLLPFMVFASAGTTNTGTIDPLDAIADVANQFELWYHVDAAYGGFFMLCEEYKEKFKGIERSDSITIDPHKGLFLSYGIGALLIKNTQALQETHHYMANYMQDAFDAAEDPSPADMSPELTKHFRGLRMWISLQLFGVEPFRAALSEKILLCRYFYEEIQKLGFEVGPYPDLSVAIFRFQPEEGDATTFNQELTELIKKDGRYFMSTTTIDGVYWIRMAMLSFRTHLEDVDELMGIIKQFKQALEKQPLIN